MTSTTNGAHDFSTETTMSRGIGWLSIALGVTELAIPRILAKVIGVEADRRSAFVIRTMGVRQLAHGISVLLLEQHPAPLWSRVAGDVIDLVALGIGGNHTRTSRLRLAGAAASVVGLTALDVIAGIRTQRAYASLQEPVRGGVTIARPVTEVYDFYRDLGQLPRFMHWLERVDVMDDLRSHWVARLPIGCATIGWDTEIVEDRPGEVIGWRSAESSRVEMSGRVLFSQAPGGDSTEVRVEIQLGFDGMEPSARLSRFFTTSQVTEDLLRLKQTLETGEVVPSETGVHRGPPPAQPGEPAQEVPAARDRENTDVQPPRR